MALERDDWRLTAYALGELDAADTVAVEDLLARDESARQTVAEIRQAAGALSEGMQAFDVHALTNDRRQAILAARRSGRLRRWAVPLAVAAGVLLAVAVGWIVLAGRGRPREGPDPGVAKKSDGLAKPGAPKPDMENTPGYEDPMKPRHNATPRVARQPSPPGPSDAHAPRVAPALAQGTRNIAFGRPVASSCEPFSGILEWITDADTEPHGSSHVELAEPGLQWIQIDLGRPCEIRAIVVWHCFRSRRAYHDVIVQVSDDAAFGREVRALFNNDQDNSAGLGAGTDREYIESGRGLVIDGRRVRGRYVRLYSNGSTHDDRNHYVEVEVYGRGAE
jgi:hypothetical protein